MYCHGWIKIFDVTYNNFFCNELICMCVRKLFAQLFCHDIPVVFLALDENNFDKSIFNLLIDILVPNINMLGMTGGFLHSWLKTCSNIVYSNSNWIMDLNFDALQKLVINMISWTASESATNSSSGFERVMLLCALLL